MNTVLKFVTVLATSAFVLRGAVPMGDQTFARKAAQGGLAEVRLGQLAVSNGSSQRVKDFGQRMVDDHTRVNDKLRSIAGKDDLMLPTDLSTKDQALLKRLSGLSGAEFDKAYMDEMVKDHQADIADFEKEADSGRNSDLKSFASSTLPMLQEHLRIARDTAGSVGAISMR